MLLKDLLYRRLPSLLYRGFPNPQAVRQTGSSVSLPTTSGCTVSAEHRTIYLDRSSRREEALIKMAVKALYIRFIPPNRWFRWSKREASWSAVVLHRFRRPTSGYRNRHIAESLPTIPPFHEPPVHWNHRLTLPLATILPLLGERAGVRADVSSSRRDWLLPRFMVREQFPSEQAAAHEPPVNHPPAGIIGYLCDWR